MEPKESYVTLLPCHPVSSQAHVCLLGGSKWSPAQLEWGLWVLLRSCSNVKHACALQNLRLHVCWPRFINPVSDFGFVKVSKDEKEGRTESTRPRERVLRQGQ